MPTPPRAAFRLFAAAVVTAAALSGCSTKPPAVAKESDKRNEDPWPRAAADLRRESDLGSARRILEQLRTDLVTNGDPRFQPASLSAEQEKTLRALLTLTDREVAEVRPSTYSALDAQHVAECYYLRDAVRSLGLAGLPPERQARVAFDWVVRQVVLSPWITTLNGQRQVMPPAPPSLVLARGAGSGLERAYVFLGLLRQVGLDGCLVGPPEAANRGWAYAANPKPDAMPRGPFWAVGVRVGPHLYLYDPWRGEPVPGPATNTGGVATLGQVQANPGFLKPWRDDAANPWDVPAEDVARAVPFLAAPLSAFAPRFERLEAELHNDAPAVRLYADAAALKARFAGEGKSPAAAFWNPADEGFTPVRVLSSYVPPQEGGSAVIPQLAAKFRADFIPLGLFTVPEVLRPRAPTGPNDPGDPGVPEAIDRVKVIWINAYAQSFVAPPSPLERIQRGQFAEVTPLLVQRRKLFLDGQERLRAGRGREEELAKWVEAAKELYTKLLRARDREKTDPAAVAVAAAEVEAFWKRDVATETALADAAGGEAGAAEATYLLALCLHEQAERAQLAYDLARDGKRNADRAREAAVAAWAEAAGWWKRYEPYAATQGRQSPARPAHAARLAAEAQARRAQ